MATGWYVPAAQSAHSAVLPVLVAFWKRLPAGQASHASVSTLEAGAVLLRTFPETQSMHDVCADAGWYLSESHAVHATATSELAGAAFRYCPAAHATHWAAPSLGWKTPLLLR